MWQRTKQPGLYRQTGPAGTRYKVRYRDGASTLRSKTFPRLKDAEVFLSDTKVKRALGSLPDLAAGKVTLGEFFEHFMATATNLRPSTRARYRLHGRYLVEGLGERRLSSIAKADVRRFLAELTDEGRGAATVAAVHRLLHRALEIALEEDRIPRNPAHGVKVTQTQRRAPRFFSAGEVGAIARQVPDRYRVLVYFLAYSGLRIGEATALRVRNIDLKTDVVRVVENSPEVGGVKLLGQATKTGRFRVAHMPATLRKMVADHLDRFGNRFEADSLVFTAEGGGPVRQYNFRKRVFQQAARAAKIDPVPTVHELRHTAASLMAQAGYSMREAQEQLGHSHAGMTDKYTHLFPDDRAAKVRALDRLMGQTGLTCTDAPW